MSTRARFIDPETVALRLIEAAASAGVACPSNETIAHAIGAASVSTGARLVQVLERRGLIRVDRFGMARRIEVVATGDSTAAIEGAPHWSARGVRKAPPRPRPAPNFGEPDRRFRGLPPVDRFVDRDPCWRCGVRADLGCRHRPASGTAPVALADDPGDARRERETAYSFMTRTRK